MPRTTALAGSDTALFRGTAGLFAVTLFLGGGGAPNPIVQGLLEALAFGWLTFLAWLTVFRRDFPRDGRALWCVVAAVLVVTLIELAPLPYTVWSALPGRELPARVLAAASLGKPWMPLSLDPAQTVVSVIALIPGVALSFSFYHLAPVRRIALVRIAIVVILISALLGAVQASMPGTPALYIHKKTYFDLPSGLFANRNFQGELLLQGILLCALQLRLADARAALGSRRVRLAPFDILCLVAIPFLAIMALATVSRFAALMLGPVLVAGFVLAWKPSLRLFAVAAAAMVAAAGAFAVVGRTLSASLMERFRQGGSRSEMIPDIWAAVRHYFPAGSGLGTFDPAFRQFESLDKVGPSYLNHAHNDYLEILLETGIVGGALAALGIAIFAGRSIHLWRKASPGSYALFQRTAVLGVALTLLHSAVDYPLRTMTIQGLVALYLTIVFSAAPEPGPRHSRGSAR